MHNFVAQLRRPFVRQAGVLQIGLFARIGIGLLLSVTLARLLGVEGFGVYALVTATFTTISLFKRLGQDYVATTSLAVAYARLDAALARRALVFFNVVNVWSTVVVVPLALLLAPAIAGWLYKNESLADPLRLALLPAIWALLAATVVLVLQCSRRLAALAVLETSDTLIVGLSGLLLVLAGGGVSGFFLGGALGSLAIAMLALAIYQRIEVSDALLPSVRDLAGAVARPDAGTWTEFRSGLAVALDKNLVSLYRLAPILLLGALASAQQVALLQVALTYVGAPLLALSAVSRLLMVKLPELQATQPERVKRFFLQVTTTGGLISILLTLLVVVLAPWLIELLYGEAFGAASSLVILLALDPLLSGFGIAAGPVYRVYRRNIWALCANLAVLAIGLPLAYVWIQQGASGGDDLVIARAALAYAALTTLAKIVSYLLCLRIIKTQQPMGRQPFKEDRG
jgi:O-antigen/teichoic acid export membrane protein